MSLDNIFFGYDVKNGKIQGEFILLCSGGFTNERALRVFQNMGP